MATPPTLAETPRAEDLAGPKNSWLVMAVSGLAGALATFVVIRSLMTPTAVAEIRSLSGGQSVLILLSFPLSIWLAIFLHEGGHLLGGFLAGMRPLVMFAGPLKVSFERRLPSLSWNPLNSTWGGVAVSVPVGGRATHGSFALMVAGGPAASFCAALTGWGLANSVMDSVRMPSILFTVISTTIGVATLIPLRAGGFLSDGGQLLQLMKGSPLAEARANLPS